MIAIAHPTRDEVGTRLAILRNERGLSRAQVNEMTGLSSATLHNIEDAIHYPGVVILMKLCEFYGVTPNDVLLGKEET